MASNNRKIFSALVSKLAFPNPYYCPTFGPQMFSDFAIPRLIFLYFVPPHQRVCFRRHIPTRVTMPEAPVKE
jgi:hypothetical protein